MGLGPTILDGVAMLKSASEYGHINKVRQLLKSGVPVDGRTGENSWGSVTPLMLASQGGYLSTVALLLSHGANAKARSDDGWTTLHYASSSGGRIRSPTKAKKHADVIRLLIDAGADINAKENNPENMYLTDDGDFGGRTALHLASENKHSTGDVEVLLRAGADVNARNVYGRTPLHLASMKGYVATVTKLLEYRADVNAKDEDEGDTPLILAVGSGNIPTVLKLIEAGADMNAKDFEGNTAMDVASARIARVLRHAAEPSSSSASRVPLGKRSRCPAGYVRNRSNSTMCAKKKI